MSDLERLRRAFAEGDEVTASESCPPAEDLWKGARGELDPARLPPIVRHLRICPACAHAWRAAQEEAPAESAPIPRPRFPATWIRLAAAAVLVMAVVSVFLLLQRPDPPTPVFRSTETPHLRSLVADGSALPRQRFLLRWEDPEPAARYTVWLHREDLTPVFVGRGLTESELLVPAERFTDIAPGERLVWRVEAEREDGRVLRSDAFLVVLE